MKALLLAGALFIAAFASGREDGFRQLTRCELKIDKQIVEGVFAEISRRPVPDVLVIGHTDTVGTDQVNDALSRQRAETVRIALIDHGVAPAAITVIGRGKREPVILTGEGVSEPRNRRVEIIVR